MATDFGRRLIEILDDLNGELEAKDRSSWTARAQYVLTLSSLEVYFTEAATEQFSRQMRDDGKEDAVRAYLALGRKLGWNKKVNREDQSLYSLLHKNRRTVKGRSNREFSDVELKVLTPMIGDKNTEELRSLIRKDFENLNLSRPEKIEATLARCCDCFDAGRFWDSVAGQLNLSENYRAACQLHSHTVLGSKFVRDQLDLAVQRRNHIVHSLDVRHDGIDFDEFRIEFNIAVLELARAVISSGEKLFIA